MGRDDGLNGADKHDRSEVHSSADFRKKPGLAQKIKDFLFGAPSEHSTRPEPELGPLTTPIGIPFIGAVRSYYLLLVAVLVLFILTKSAIIGLLGGLTIVFIVAWEFYCGLKTGGVKAELRETAYAILIALVIWFGSGFLLHTPTPINAIVSCSMLPAYQRGDLVILQGAPALTQVVNYDGPSSDVNSTATIHYQNQTETVEGSMLAYCAGGSSDPWCQAFLQQPQAFVESHGPVIMQYGPCERYYPATGQTVTTICVDRTQIAGPNGAAIDVPFNASYNLLVYTPKPGDYYSSVGDIVHRAAFALNTTTGVVYFSKGDNNPIYDFQAYGPAVPGGPGLGNSPISPSQIKGKVIARIPYLGNLKLFITPQVLVGDATNGCDSYYSQPN